LAEHLGQATSSVDFSLTNRGQFPFHLAHRYVRAAGLDK
jgi:hypothetical protein